MIAKLPHLRTFQGRSQMLGVDSFSHSSDNTLLFRGNLSHDTKINWRTGKVNTQGNQFYKRYRRSTQYQTVNRDTNQLASCETHGLANCRNYVHYQAFKAYVVYGYTSTDHINQQPAHFISTGYGHEFGNQ